MRRNSEQEFKRIYKCATKFGKDLNGEEFELSTPRLSKRQSHRANPDSEDYYRVTLFNEFLSNVVSELQQRFLDRLHLLPSECISAAEVNGDHEDIVIPQSLVEAVRFYKNDLPHPVMFSTEYHMWVRKWRGETNEDPKKLMCGGVVMRLHILIVMFYCSFVLLYQSLLVNVKEASVS